MSNSPLVFRKAKSIKTTSSQEEIEQEIRKVLEVILKRILLAPEHLKIEIKHGDQTTIFEIDIGLDDYGRLLGTKGRNISALRTLALGMSATYGFRSIISIKDEDRFFQR